MTPKIHTKKGLLNLFASCSNEVRGHFKHIPGLLSSYPMEVALAYVFQRLELGQNMALYCGVVKLHRANSAVARNAVDSHHMTREGFASLYETIFALGIPTVARENLKLAERTRDTIMHGGRASEDRLRNAIGRVLEFAEAVNQQLQAEHKLRPFCGSWRGFAGRLGKLDPKATRFMLKGIGFALS